MKRAKIKGKSNETKMKKKYTSEAVDFVTILTEAATLDVFNATPEQINEWKETINRYARHVTEGVVKLEDFKKRNRKGNTDERTKNNN